MQPDILYRSLDAPAITEVPRDYAVVAATHPVFIPYLLVGTRVKTGTPLRPAEGGWQVAFPHGEGAQCLAATAAQDGDQLKGWRTVTLETYRPQFRVGESLAIAGIDDFGQPVFAPHPTGPCVALSASQVFVDCNLLRGWKDEATEAEEATTGVLDATHGEGQEDTPRNDRPVR